MRHVGTFAIVLAGALMLPACTIGTRLSSIENADSPRGAHGTVRTAGTVVHNVPGELIAVRDDGLLVLTDSAAVLTLFRSSQIDRTDFGDVPRLDGGGSAIDAISRYPLGLNDSQLDGLLEALGQSALVVWEP